MSDKPTTKTEAALRLAKALLVRHKMLRDAYRGDEVRILPDGTRAIDVICQLYDALAAIDEVMEEGKDA